MIRRISPIAFLCLSVCLLGRDEYTRSFDKTVTMQAGQRFRLEHSLGDVVVRTHSSSDVTIHADIRVSAPDSNEAKSFADNIAILIEPSSSLVSVRTRYPERPSSFFGMHNVSYTVHYEITVPQSAPLEIRNSFGAVDVSGVRADCDIKTSHGSLSFRDGRGSQRLENSFASIQASDNHGDLTVENSNASVNVSDITGNASIRDRFGSVDVSESPSLPALSIRTDR